MKKRNVIVPILICLLTALLCCALVACNNDTTGGDDTPNKACTHNWVKEGTVASTCNTYGYTNYVCTLCGETKRETDTVYGSHVFTDHKCTVCNEREATEITFTSGDLSIYVYDVTGLSDSAKYDFVVFGNGASDSYASSSSRGWDAITNNVVTLRIESGVTSLGDYFCYGFRNLTKIICADSLNTLGAHSFEYCSSIATAEMNGLVTVGAYAFKGCDYLTDLKLPSAEKIAPYGLFGTNSLKTLVIGGVDGTLTGADARFGAMFGYTSEEFTDYGQVSTVDGTNYYYRVPTKLNSVTLAGKVNVPDRAFDGVQKIGTIELSGEIEGIGAYAFASMVNMHNFSAHAVLLSIGQYAFYNCTALEKFVVPSGVTLIGAHAFEGCNKMTDLTFGGDELTEIKEYAFARCSALTKVVIGSKVTNIGASAFYSCSSLNTVTVGAGVESIANNAFKDCSKLYTLYVDSEWGLHMTNNLSGLFGNAEKVYLKGTPDVTSYVAKNFESKGADPNGYYLWEK